MEDAPALIKFTCVAIELKFTAPSRVFTTFYVNKLSISSDLLDEIEQTV